MRRALLALVLLAACGRFAGVPEPAQAPSFRDREQPIASTTRGTAQDLSGNWVISESYPGLPFAAPGTQVTLGVGPEGAVAWQFAGPGGERTVLTSTGLPGRFIPRGQDQPEFWVLWVDDDFRTAVVGVPDGRYGWVMNRPGDASADRTVAAREMLDFNGYDVTRLTGS